MSKLNHTLGRIGTALIAVCLALTILTLIPRASLGLSSTGSRVINPESYAAIGSPINLSPQTMLKIELETNTTVTLYLIEAKPNRTISFESGNETDFDRFIEENAERTLIKEETSGNVTLEYTPEGVTSIIPVILNEEPAGASIQYKVELLASIAPSARIITAIEYLAPLGVILVGQWIITKRRTGQRILRAK
ncbi:hypothetical protein H5T51_07115 [Candidatus Bathyarchaeota archaeon]|nr:hypothetical protein [Candidatus Bathyarchaeota archaeon]